MCRKLSCGEHGIASNHVAISVGRLTTNKDYQNPGAGRTKEWEKAIKDLMSDFGFTDLQKKSVMEKAKASFTPQDGNTQKYNKAWKYFKEVMMTM